MRHRTLALIALLTLGCSGFTERLVEMSGTDMVLTEDGAVTLTLPDGSRIETHAGGDRVPEDFAVPPPWPEAEPETTVIMTRADGQVSYIVTWPLDRPRADVIGSYVDWMTEQGVEVKREKEGTFGLVVESITGELASGEGVAITVSEAWGQNTVSVVVAEGGLDNLPE